METNPLAVIFAETGVKLILNVKNSLSFNLNLDLIKAEIFRISKIPSSKQIILNEYGKVPKVFEVFNSKDPKKHRLFLYIYRKSSEIDRACDLLYESVCPEVNFGNTKLIELKRRIRRQESAMGSAVENFCGHRQKKLASFKKFSTSMDVMLKEYFNITSNMPKYITELENRKVPSSSIFRGKKRMIDLILPSEKIKEICVKFQRELKEIQKSLSEKKKLFVRLVSSNIQEDSLLLKNTKFKEIVASESEYFEHLSSILLQNEVLSIKNYLKIKEHQRCLKVLYRFEKSIMQYCERLSILYLIKNFQRFFDISLLEMSTRCQFASNLNKLIQNECKRRDVFLSNLSSHLNIKSNDMFKIFPLFAERVEFKRNMEKFSNLTKVCSDEEFKKIIENSNVKHSYEALQPKMKTQLSLFMKEKIVEIESEKKIRKSLSENFANPQKTMTQNDLQTTLMKQKYESTIRNLKNIIKELKNKFDSTIKFDKKRVYSKMKELETTFFEKQKQFEKKKMKEIMESQINEKNSLLETIHSNEKVINEREKKLKMMEETIHEHSEKLKTKESLLEKLKKEKDDIEDKSKEMKFLLETMKLEKEKELIEKKNEMEKMKFEKEKELRHKNSLVETMRMEKGKIEKEKNKTIDKLQQTIHLHQSDLEEERKKTSKLYQTLANKDGILKQKEKMIKSMVVEKKKYENERNEKIRALSETLVIEKNINENLKKEKRKIMEERRVEVMKIRKEKEEATKKYAKHKREYEFILKNLEEKDGKLNELEGLKHQLKKKEELVLSHKLEMKKFEEELKRVNKLCQKKDDVENQLTKTIFEYEHKIKRREKQNTKQNSEIFRLGVKIENSEKEILKIKKEKKLLCEKLEKEVGELKSVNKFMMKKMKKLNTTMEFEKNEFVAKEIKLNRAIELLEEKVKKKEQDLENLDSTLLMLFKKEQK